MISKIVANSSEYSFPVIDPFFGKEKYPREDIMYVGGKDFDFLNESRSSLLDIFRNGLNNISKFISTNRNILLIVLFITIYIELRIRILKRELSKKN